MITGYKYLKGVNIGGGGINMWDGNQVWPGTGELNLRGERLEIFAVKRGEFISAMVSPRHPSKILSFGKRTDTTVLLKTFSKLWNFSMQLLNITPPPPPPFYLFSLSAFFLRSSFAFEQEGQKQIKRGGKKQKKKIRRHIIIFRWDTKPFSANFVENLGLSYFFCGHFWGFILLNKSFSYSYLAFFSQLYWWDLEWVCLKW